MSNYEMRALALNLAIQQGSTEPLEAAKKFYEFMKGRSETKPAPRKAKKK